MAAEESGGIKRPYIKKVVIEGFKTYGKLTGLQEFDPGMNVLGTISSANYWPVASSTR
jgi:hypothetical protein